ncbi:MAG: hypothetical protein IPP17_25825 [Bacteroidetes bacterium]|nr:hypothetical protein [Bacteroidota bacterium]
MRKFIYLIGGLFCFGFLGCGAQKSHEVIQNVVVAPPTSISKVIRETGKVIESESSRHFSSSYAVYLLKSHHVDRPLPVIVFFDSHARGKDPVKKYAALAEAQPFVLIGSNVSRNGQRPEQSLQIYDELMRCQDQICH